ncbi:MAG: hypothetical protein ACRDPY_02275 [Streptosporangiaceae bacterium]
MSAELRRSVAGLLSFAAASEEALLAAVRFAGPASSSAEGADGPGNWGAVPVVAHNNHFKEQQAERLQAIVAGRIPPSFGEIDHSSASVYGQYRAQPLDRVLLGCRLVTAELVDGTWAVPDEDLLDPARHPWLRGRMLWLQIVVRGFWHPTGHVGDYYLGHGEPLRAVEMHAHAVATARYLGAPAPAVGMAIYSLACAQGRVGRLEEAASSLASAVAANADLRVNASRDPDLAALRSAGLVDGLDP